jgi:hypothetical protein
MVTSSVRDFRPQRLAVRVDNLERRVEALEALPERMTRLELQFVQFREEVRNEFSAVRDELRAEIQAQGEQLCAEIRAGDEETRRLMRDHLSAEDYSRRIGRSGGQL